MSIKPRIYADSCCFIEAVRHQRGVPLSANKDEAERREKDCWFFKKLCDASRDGAIRLMTSVLSVAECLHVDEPGGPSEETRELFIDFLTSGVIVELAEPDVFVAERARDLLWDDGVLLSGADSLHVATALLSECVEFLTLDGKITKKKKFALVVPQLKKIGLSVLRPSQTGNLPNEYRTEDLFDAATQQAATSTE